MNAFLERLLGREDPMVGLVRDELAFAKRVDSFFELALSVEDNDEAERELANDFLSRVASLRYQAKTIKRQDRSWGVLRRFYGKETFAIVGLRNLEAVEKFLNSSSELRQRFMLYVR